jgi:hypothetical protein
MADKATAKMAESARRLPKWQPQQILCQTLCQIGNSKCCAKNRAMKKSPQGFFLFFFLAMDDK